ncbi:hypothetical protein GN277_17880 [Lachnospiraceae bacterium WCA-9-b2]|jgi:hypothetical protein|uniref:Uncharacterized protein n=1 Tax=Sporofaciens musculi TaxID=2681861 RepID=A0A7X3MIR7_9FIRM|nr:hypothetical protein [Sporofaciens musculi]MXP77175.1 hypothetical protein [Sporofaciens musculi]
MAYNNESIRNKLIEITNKGLMLKAIALNIGLDVNNLSRFKGGLNSLKESDVKLLSEYLDAVVIPQWNTIAKRQNTESKGKRRKVSLDLLRELDS